MQEVDGTDTEMHQFPVGVFWRRDSNHRYAWAATMADGRTLRVRLNVFDLNEDGEPSRKSWLVTLGMPNRQGTMVVREERKATSKPGAMYLAFQLWFSTHPHGVDLNLLRRNGGMWANYTPDAQPHPLRPGHVERVLDFGDE